MKTDYPKIALFVITALIVLGVSYTYLFPSATLGDFSKFSNNSEINQPVNVEILKDREIERTPEGNVLSFFARDKNNVELKISLHDPVPGSVLNAEMVELLGHLHGNVFSATRVVVVK